MISVVIVQIDTAFSEHIKWIWPIWNTTQQNSTTLKKLLILYCFKGTLTAIQYINLFTAGLGNLFTITSRMNCAISLVSRKIIWFYHMVLPLC